MSFLKSVYHYLIALGAYWFYGRPSRKMIVIGVTGTKGKSSTVRFIAEVLRAGGHKVGSLSTVEFQIDKKIIPNDKKMTMLGRGQIQKMLREMLRAGCEYAVVETSSEGILQHRHVGLDYDICVFTNLGTEHSERHGGFENLRADKGKIFTGLKKTARKKINGREIKKIIVANIDDANADYYLSFKADQKITFGLQIPAANVFGKILSNSAEESSFEVENKKYIINVPGSFNVYNALAAIAVARTQGINDERIYRGLRAVAQIPGRMEFIRAGQPFGVVVDYAHEPMSLAELFTNLRRFIGNKNKIIALIGSDGGGRDVHKREQMGRIAGELADIVVVTDVNCFDEDPNEIAEMLAVGARGAGKRDGVNLIIDIDRRAAIAKAIQTAEPGDVVAITAKGTEPCMVFAGGRKVVWDDRAVAREILQSYGSAIKN